MLNGLDLFSGIGGLTLALEPWVRPVTYCENDRYAQAVLLSRIRERSLPYAPIWDDVRTLPARDLPAVDIVYGGFPCQDISCAGNGKGLVGERSGLFYELLRLVRETSPRFVFLENVPAIRTRGLREVVGSLAELGFDCRWMLISAEEMGAPHKRSRWFLLAAHPERFELRDEQGRSGGENRPGPAGPGDDGAAQSLADSPSVRRREGRSGSEVLSGRDDVASGGQPLADPDFPGLEVGVARDSGQCSPPFGEDWWESEPDVGRVVNGLPFRVDRIKGLGNSVVPAQAREAFKRLAGLP